MMNIFQRYKRLFIFAGLIIITALVGILIYYFLFANPGTGPNANNNTNSANNNGHLPNANGSQPGNQNNATGNTNGSTSLPTISPIANGGATRIADVTSGQIANGAPTPDGGYVYYDKNTNKFYKVSANGQIQEISSKEFFGVSNVVWSADSQQAIISYPDGSKTYYNFTTDRTVTLPKEVQNPDFTNSGDQLAYKYVSNNTDNNWLAMSSPDGTNQQILEPIGDRGNNVQVNWSPDSQVVATYHEDTGLNQEEVYFIGRNGENFKSMTVDGSGFTSQWSPDGQQMLYSVFNEASGYRPVLSITNGQRDSVGANTKDLQLNTWPDKCTFGNGSLYCGVPTELPEGAGLEPALSSLTPDNIYKIDLTTGQQSLVAVPTGDDGRNHYNVENPYLSSDGSLLYFYNPITGKLESLQLK